jgi:hypothetical protein
MTPPDLAARRAAERERLAAHRGLATCGERLVPLGLFRHEVGRHGRVLAAAERQTVLARYKAPADDGVPVEGPYGRVAVFGGVYSNHLALSALLEAADRQGAEAVYCLGDLGGFGPNPDKVWPLLAAGGVRVVQGNYEQSLAAGAGDCHCGYADPRDNHFAALSYRYTAEHTAAGFKRWMGEQPQRRRILVGERELLLVHGSPRRINEFLFRSTSPVAFLELLVRQSRCRGLLCTHTGLPWHRRLPSGADVVNVGAIGRPANDGRTEVWYALLEAGGGELRVDLSPLAYDHPALAAEMRQEGLPPEFVETIETGWWTTCLEILPPKERAAGRW